MKLTNAVTLIALFSGYASASPAVAIVTHTSMILPTGIPATSGLPFSTLSFDTTASPSLLSALSSLISSESTALTPLLPTTPIPTTTPTSNPTIITSTVVPSSTNTGGALSLRGVGWGVGMFAGVVVGAVAVLL